MQITSFGAILSKDEVLAAVRAKVNEEVTLDTNKNNFSVFKKSKGGSSKEVELKTVVEAVEEYLKSKGYSFIMSSVTENSLFFGNDGYFRVLCYQNIYVRIYTTDPDSINLVTVGSYKNFPIRVEVSSPKVIDGVKDINAYCRDIADAAQNKFGTNPPVEIHRD